MKRYALYMLIMAAAAVAACQVEPVNELNSNDPDTPVVQEVQKGTYTYTINASIKEDEAPAEVAVKSDYDASGHFSWSAGDAISVLFHNGATNKFFTLTTTGTGSSASFSGEIESGYTIGASDGTVDDKKIWALFPASDMHSYTPGGRPAFYIPAVNDFTAPGAHFSANLPMYDLLDSEGNFSFKYLTCGFKFTITDIDVSKIRVEIENQASYYLSGDISMSSGPYLSFGNAGSYTSKTITYVCNVTSRTAVFYVACRYAAQVFQPIITIKDDDTGYTIKTVTATKKAEAIDAKGKVQRVTLSAPGLGKPFDSLLGVDWSAVGGALSGATGSYAGITSIKGTADDTYVYLLVEIPESELLLGHKYTNTAWFYLGTDLNESGDWKWSPKRTTEDVWIGYIMKRSSPYADGSNYKAYKCKDNIFFEARVARSSKSYLTDPGTVYVGAVVYNGKYTEEDDSIGSEHDNFMYAPAASSGMLEVTLP